MTGRGLSSPSKPMAYSATSHPATASPGIFSDDSYTTRRG